MEEKHLDQFTVCDCGSMGHLVRLAYDQYVDGDEDLTIGVTMNHYLGFWGRVKMALKYIFKRDNDWHYDAVIINKARAQQIRDFINETILVGENIR
jgi:hypothetical protein